jgi:NTP pyrophosphatase (non-canonical NTP hydrolase)
MRDISELAERLRDFAAARDWEQFHTPKNLVMALAGEAGELLAEFQWLTPEEAAGIMADPQAARQVRAEMSDVFLYLTRLADVLGVDLLGEAADKLAENERRYDVANYRGSRRKAPVSAITLLSRGVAHVIDQALVWSCSTGCSPFLSW